MIYYILDIINMCHILTIITFIIFGYFEFIVLIYIIIPQVLQNIWSEVTFHWQVVGRQQNHGPHCQGQPIN